MRRNKSAARGFAALLLGLALAAAPLSAWAQEEAPPRNAYSGLVGIGAALGTLVYAPLKLCYALTGSLLSGMAWVWTAGDGSIATPILHSAIKGDYVLTPAHLEGRRPIGFVGSQY
ncbi:MAG: hypothetical protein JRH16_07375 [Deltaproteobacteria bacterium]|nr:hypothetical protein [Deltaproteobacteria bacterium]MBW2362015.1 hypothetical protein [Deltaproteobacteria bacterium]